MSITNTLLENNETRFFFLYFGDTQYIIIYFIQGEAKYLHEDESLKTRVQILSTNPNLGEGYSMLLKLINKLPLR